MQTITLMMEWEALFLEEIETGINEEWSKTKMKIKIPRIIEIMKIGRASCRERV